MSNETMSNEVRELVEMGADHEVAKRYLEETAQVEKQGYHFIMYGWGTLKEVMDQNPAYKFTHLTNGETIMLTNGPASRHVKVDLRVVTNPFGVCRVYCKHRQWK